jgi:predicted CXXCH cytochrome family protein
MRTLLTMAFFIVAGLAAQDSCIECHGKLDGKQSEAVGKFQQDVHKTHGFRCSDCHGGDPGSSQKEVAMSPARGFRGAIDRKVVPQLCARCHSDANLMHKYNPRQRVDQLAQYQTSLHGKRLAAGDTATANCVDCHSVHDIRSVKDPLSPVHPLKLPGTCARCHTDSSRMNKYKLASTQYDEYRKSVHWKALEQRGDLSAPSCASCHGNHGAAPPNVSEVAAVCGTCHVMMEKLYRDSPHRPVFEAMGSAGCVACHSNHEVKHPGPEMLVGADAVCAQCHDADSTGGKTAAEMSRLIGTLTAQLARSDEILNRARRSGMEVSPALMRQTEAQEKLVRARVAVHAFRVAAVEAPVKEGLVITNETHATGRSALEELGRRRNGLLVSLGAIGLTILGLWLWIRSVERRGRGVPEPGPPAPN